MKSDRCLHRAVGKLLASAVVFILIHGTAAPHLSQAQQPIWVTVEGLAPAKIKDLKSARQQAIVIAEHNAVIQALATEVTVDSLLVNLRLAGSIINAIPYGKVIRKEILEEGPVPTPDDEKAGSEASYRVRIKAAVQQQFDDSDPSLQLEANLNQTVFKSGDPLEIRIQSNNSCYFAIFNILEGNTIVQLLPNNLSRRNRLAANDNFTFPGADEKKSGLTIRVHLPEGKVAATEAIYIMALAQPFELASLDVQKHAFGVFEGRRTFMQDVIREVATIPFSQRAEKLIQYEIRKPVKGK